LEEGYVLRPFTGDGRPVLLDDAEIEEEFEEG
jgi:hypothetical protein